MNKWALLLLALGTTAVVPFLWAGLAYAARDAGFWAHAAVHAYMAVYSGGLFFSVWTMVYDEWRRP